MELTTFRLKYDGGEADHHRLLAYDGTKSIEGFTWALTVVLGYAATGTIRKQGDPSAAVKIYMQPSRPGSYTVDLVAFLTQPENKFLTSILGTVTVSAATTFACALVSRVFSMAVGKALPDKEKGSRYLNRLPKSDIDDLVMRVEPPLTRAHAAIGKSARTVKLLAKKTELIEFDEGTKIYLESKIEDDPKILYTNVSAFNALWHTGRLYDKERGRTVPFKVFDNAMKGTETVISESLRNYTRGWPSEIRITARREMAGDRRLKRYHITAAEHIDDDDLLG